MSGRSRDNARVSVPRRHRKILREIRERAGGKHSKEDVYTMLKACNMNKDEASERLLSKACHMESKSKQINSDVIVFTSNTNEISEIESNSSARATELLPIVCTETSDNTRLKNKHEKLQVSDNLVVILPNHIQDQPKLSGITFGSFNSSIVLSLLNASGDSQDSAPLSPSHCPQEKNKGTSLSILQNFAIGDEELPHHESAGCIHETAFSMDISISQSFPMVHQSGHPRRESELTHAAPLLIAPKTVPALKSSFNSDSNEASDVPGISSRSAFKSTSTTSVLMDPQGTGLISRSDAVMKQTAPVAQKFASLHSSDYNCMDNYYGSQFLQSGSHQPFCNSALTQQQPSILLLPPLAYNAVHKGYGLYLPHPVWE